MPSPSPFLTNPNKNNNKHDDDLEYEPVRKKQRKTMTHPPTNVSLPSPFLITHDKKNKDDLEYEPTRKKQKKTMTTTTTTTTMMRMEEDNNNYPSPPPPLFKVGVMEMLRNPWILKDLPAISEDVLLSGTYFIIGLEQMGENSDLIPCVYLLNGHTNHVERVSLFNENFYQLFTKVPLLLLPQQIQQTKWIPIISINISSTKCSIEIKASCLLENTDYKDFNEWEVQSCFPLSGCRLVKIAMKENDADDQKLLAKYFAAGHIEKFEEKLAMFKYCHMDYPWIESIHDTLPNYKYMYIIGHREHERSKAYKSFIVVVEDPQYVYNVCVYDDILMVKELLRMLDAQPVTTTGRDVFKDHNRISSYNEILYGDYVLKVELEEPKKGHAIKRETGIQIISLRHTPFYGKIFLKNTFG